MPNQYTSDKKTIGELLSTTSPNINVPDFQRNFSWDTNHVEIFWQDLLAFSEQYPGSNLSNQEYFLGSIVLVNSGATHVILDGQQRLATATILLSTIRDYVHEFRGDTATRTSQKYITDIDDATEQISYSLTLNQYDREFFRREVQEERVGEYSPPAPEIRSHGLIRKAQNFFRQRFEEKYQSLGRGKEAFDWSLRVQKVLTDHVSVVAVASSDEDNAASVFETLNDRGVALSTPDLVRGLILRRAPPDRREEIISCWRDVLEMEEDAKVEDFLRHYWLSQQGDVKTRSLYREIKRNVINEDTDSVEFSRDLQQAATVYKDLVAGKDEDPEAQRLLESVNMLGAKSLLPVLLSAYAVIDSPARRRQILQSLVTLFVRHNVIGNLENSRLETVVFRAAEQLRRDGDVRGAIAAMKDLAPSDDQFLNDFKTAEVSRAASARYILRELEHAKRSTQEVEVETPDRVHVEHVYPQNPQAGERWDDHSLVIHRLGNQTLLARRLNTAIRNSNFEAKKPYYEDSDLLLTKELTSYVFWDIDAINDRQAMMSDLALPIWNFPS